MGRKEKDLSECMFCMRKLKQNIQSLKSLKCKLSCIKEKLMSFISPSDYKSLNDDNLFPDPHICNSCFNLVNTIDRDTLRVESFIGNSVNFQVDSDAAIHGEPEEKWPEHKKSYKPKTVSSKITVGKVRSERSSSNIETNKNTEASEKTFEKKVKALPPRKVKGHSSVLVKQSDSDGDMDEHNLAVGCVDLDDSMDDEDYIPNERKSKTISVTPVIPIRTSSRVRNQTSSVKPVEINMLKPSKLQKSQSRNFSPEEQSKRKKKQKMRPEGYTKEQIFVAENTNEQQQQQRKSRRLRQKNVTEKSKQELKSSAKSVSKQSMRCTRASQAVYLTSLPSAGGLQEDSFSRPEKVKQDTEDVIVSETSDENEKKLLHNKDQNPTNDMAKPGVANEEFRCDTCNKPFTTKYSLATHAISHSGKRPFKCHYPDCNKAYAYETSLTEHKLGHENKLPHKCPYKECGKAFVRSRDLKTHITLHTGEKPFKCEYPGCDKAYRLRNQFYIHRRMHTGERPYKCEYEGCDRDFIRRKSLKLHEASHSSEQPYCCEECGKRFTHIRYFKLHKISHQKRVERLTQPPPEKNLPCEMCGKMFSTKVNVRRHINLVHKGVKPKRRMDKVYLCEIHGCNRSFRWKSCMVRHQALKHRREDYKHRGKLVKYICPVETCKEEFNRRNLLREHSIVVHGKTAEHGDPKTFKEWMCFECGMAVTKKQMSRHKDTYHSPGSLFNFQEQGEYICMTEQCGLKFNNAEDLKLHIPSHIGKPPYKCSKEGCKKTFLLKKNLDLHTMVHNNIKPFRCSFEGCDKNFVTQLCLMRHSKVHYDGMYVCPVETCLAQFRNMNNAGGHLAGHRGEDPYVCGICGAVFTAYNPWARHKKRHASALGGKPHICPECGKGFALKSELARHLPVHSEEKPYSCEICGMGYASKTGYSCHKLTHGEKKYFCSHVGCGKGFTLPLTLKRHQAMHNKPSNLCCYCGKILKNSLNKHKCASVKTIQQDATFVSLDGSEKAQIPQTSDSTNLQFSSQQQPFQDPSLTHMQLAAQSSQSQVQQPPLQQSHPPQTQHQQAQYEQAQHLHMQLQQSHLQESHLQHQQTQRQQTQQQQPHNQQQTQHPQLQHQLQTQHQQQRQHQQLQHQQQTQHQSTQIHLPQHHQTHLHKSQLQPLTLQQPQQQQHQQQQPLNSPSTVHIVNHELQPHILQSILSMNNTGTGSNFQLLNNVIVEGSMPSMSMSQSLSNVPINSIPLTSTPVTSLQPHTSVALSTMSLTAMPINNMPQTSVPLPSLPPMTLPFSSKVHPHYLKQNYENKVGDYTVLYDNPPANEAQGCPNPSSNNQR